MKNLKIAYVLGNGKSRAGLDLQKLKDSGILVGCNRLYTEIDPDIICALDSPMRKEILSKNLTATYLGSIAEPYYDTHSGKDLIRQNKEYAYKNGAINLDKAIENYPSCCYNSGVTALIVTSWIENVETIYLLGFDFHHPGDKPKNNNLYNEQYSRRPKNYEVQLNQVFAACNPKVEIIAVNSSGDEKFHSKLNISKLISYEEFEKVLK